MHVLIFQHTAGEHAAAFGKHIKTAGDTSDVVRFFKNDPIPDLAAYDALLVLGGPMDVWETDENPWLIAEKQAIKTWVSDLKKPYLGICLGHQLLADALGGSCTRMEIPEIAISPVSHLPNADTDPLLCALPNDFHAMHWHGVEVTQPPESTVILASTPLCANQAMRVGNNAWGFQFHPELERGTIPSWLTDAANRKCAEDWLGSTAAADQFAADSEFHVAGFLKRSAILYQAWRDISLR